MEICGVSQCWEKCAPHIGLMFVQLFVSGWLIISSIVLKQGADPVVFALYREFISIALMYFYVLYLGIPISIDRDDFLRFSYVGLCSFINVIFTILALQYISPTRFALFQPTIPCIAAVISMLLRIEPFCMLKCFGIFLAVGGAVIIEVWQRAGETSFESNITLGMILTTIQCIGMANIIVFEKPLLGKYDPSVATFVYYSIGAVWTGLLAASWEFRFTAESFYFNSKYWPWLGLAYASTFATLLTYNLYSWAGKKLLPSTTTVYITLQPLWTAILSIFIFEEIITVPQAIGGITIICGLIVTSYSYSSKLCCSHRHEFQVEQPGRQLSIDLT